MAIAQISGSSPAQRSESAKGVHMDFKPKEKSETIIEQENKNNSTIQTGIDNQNTVKKVDEVDVKI